MFKRKKSKLSSGEQQVSIFYYWWIFSLIWFRKNILNPLRDLQGRRPHRSFQLTKRRDYLRDLEISGYWSFTVSVFRMILKNRRIFLSLIGVIIAFNIILIGLLDQDFISSLKDVVDATNSGILTGGWGEIGKAGLVVMSTFSTGGLIRNPNEAQQLVIFIIVLFSWLATVQLCRDILGGRKHVSVREALYSCGAPIIPMFIVALIILIQAIPAFVGLIIYSAARATSFMTEGVEMMIFSAVVFLMFSLSIYWITGSFFALIIVSNRGTYPLQALKIAGDMVIQRRMPILLRLIFAFFVISLIWALIEIPLILLTSWIGSIFVIIKSIPIIQLSMLSLFSFTIVFLSCYIYLLYRKVIDYDRKN